MPRPVPAGAGAGSTPASIPVSSGRRLSAPLSPALAAVEERMRALGCGPGLGPVLGEGNPGATIVLIGEAPGEREVIEGYPFAGPSGRLLDETLATAGLRRVDLWLTNVVKCRPVRETAVPGRLANRAPLVGEIKRWRPLLLDELAAVAPRIVVCLGATSARALLGRDFRLTDERGVWRTLPEGLPAPENGMTATPRVLATFHPAYIMHLEPYDTTASDDARALLLADLRAVHARAAEIGDAGGHGASLA